MSPGTAALSVVANAPGRMRSCCYGGTVGGIQRLIDFAIPLLNYFPGFPHLALTGKQSVPYLSLCAKLVVPLSDFANRHEGGSALGIGHTPSEQALVHSNTPSPFAIRGAAVLDAVWLVPRHSPFIRGTRLMSQNCLDVCTWTTRPAN
jgi:hypothetical protein